MTPFEIAIDQSVLDDLHRRLDATRWPVEPVAEPWRYGTDLAWMQEVARYWRHGYDWRAAERRLNGWPNYRARIGGIDIHFIMERGSGPDPLPLVLTHGWPGSVVEFLDVIDPLAHPERHGGDAADDHCAGDHFADRNPVIITAGLGGRGSGQRQRADGSRCDPTLRKRFGQLLHLEVLLVGAAAGLPRL